MKVAKFGGSSLCSADKIRQVAEIIQGDPEIRAVVVSAPGKRDSEDIKVTDLLIDLYQRKINHLDLEPALDKILARYQDIIQGLGLDTSLLADFENNLREILDQVTDPDRLSDALKSRGEDYNAILISAYLQSQGLHAAYVSPLEAGIRVVDQPGNARLIEESYVEIAKLRQRPEDVLVIPGFFGYSLGREIVTFSRGGSDITGAIIARGMSADAYLNFTDVNYVYSAHPGYVSNPHPISQITYREMRELSYSGFTIFHDEALEPLYEQRIPVIVKNTNHPDLPGTKIVHDRDDVKEFPVIGIAGDDGFVSITIKQYLLNRQVGYMHKLLGVFLNHNISIEHVPTGIDDISVIIRKNQFQDRDEFDAVVREIHHAFQPEWIHTETDLAVLSVVGEGMRNMTGVANKATKALADSDISLSMINQGASEISMFFAIQAKDLEKAIAAIYDEYFKDCQN